MQGLGIVRQDLALVGCLASSNNVYFGLRQLAVCADADQTRCLADNGIVTPGQRVLALTS